MDMSEKFNIKPNPNMTQEEQEQKEKLFAMFDRAMQGSETQASPVTTREYELVRIKDDDGTESIEYGD